MKNTREIEGYVPVFQKTSYSIASAGGNIISVIISMFISTYMTDSVGISAAAVGTMMFISRFLDLGTDFLVGSLVELVQNMEKHVHGFWQVYQWYFCF